MYDTRGVRWVAGHAIDGGIRVVNGVSESTRTRVLAMLGLGLAALLARLLAGTLGVPPDVERGLYLFTLGCLVACVLLIATD